MVLRQDPAAGGGEIWFDEKLIRKDGLFVLPETGSAKSGSVEVNHSLSAREHQLKDRLQLS